MLFHSPHNRKDRCLPQIVGLRYSCSLEIIKLFAGKMLLSLTIWGQCGLTLVGSYVATQLLSLFHSPSSAGWGGENETEGKKASGFEIGGVGWKERKGHGGNNYSQLPISKQCPAQQCLASKQLHESPPAPSSPSQPERVWDALWSGWVCCPGCLIWLVLPVLPMRSKRVLMWLFIIRWSFLYFGVLGQSYDCIFA